MSSQRDEVDALRLNRRTVGGSARFSLLMARRYFSGVAGRGFSVRALFAVLGVAIMIAQWTVITSINSGFIDVFRDRVLAVKPHIVLQKYGVYFSEYPELQEELEAYEEVRITAPFLLYEMQVTGADRRHRPGAAIRGVDPVRFAEMSEVDEMVTEGDFEAITYQGELQEGPAPESPPGIALGRVLAEKVDADVGDVVRLNSPLATIRNLGTSSGQTGPTWANFRVVAIFDSGFYDFDSKFAVADYRALQDIFRRGDVVSGLEIQLTDPDRTEEVIARIQQDIPDYQYQMMGWQERDSNLFASLNLQKLSFAIVSTAGFVVGAFLVLCLLIIIVLEKRSEIGILRALGASTGEVIAIFVLLGAMLGGVGTIAGLVLGYVLCLALGQVHFDLAFEVYRIAELPVEPKLLDFMFAGSVAMLLCLVATIYPAIRAARVSPVDAIRKR